MRTACASSTAASAGARRRATSSSSASCGEPSAAAGARVRIAMQGRRAAGHRHGDAALDPAAGGVVARLALVLVGDLDRARLQLRRRQRASPAGRPRAAPARACPRSARRPSVTETIAASAPGIAHAVSSAWASSTSSSRAPAPSSTRLDARRRRRGGGGAVRTRPGRLHGAAAASCSSVSSGRAAGSAVRCGGRLRRQARPRRPGCAGRSRSTTAGRRRASPAPMRPRRRGRHHARRPGRGALTRKSDAHAPPHCRLLRRKLRHCEVVCRARPGAVGGPGQ